MIYREVPDESAWKGFSVPENFQKIAIGTMIATSLYIHDLLVGNFVSGCSTALPVQKILVHLTSSILFSVVAPNIQWPYGSNGLDEIFS
jgi:hypothetical protein